jgi:hypothetical protein
METVRRDLTVIGAGLSGICAAIMAARKGVSVALVSDRPVIGGNSSSEMRMWTRGATGGENIYSEEMGILGELKLKNLYRNMEANVVFWDEILFDAVFAENNITLFLNTHVNEVALEAKQRLLHVDGLQQGSEKRFRFTSDVFVDATGDGTVGFLSGAEFTGGREGRELYGERFAPEKSDEYGLGSSLFFYSKEMNTAVSYTPPDYAYKKEEIAPLIGSGGRIINERMNGTDFWWLEYGGTRDTIRDNQDITIELKRIVFGIWDYIKNSGKFDADRLTLEWVGTLPCKRESRRLKGEYVLKQQDVEERKYFQDGVCYGGWYMDFHPPEGIFSKEEFCVQTPVSVYAIPMRCLYSRKVDNLLFAGRLISVTHAAFSSTRIMDTCALTGQAAGMIAAYMNQYHVSHDEVYREHLEEVQQDLLKNDMFIPEMQNHDPDDKAREATVTVSSVRPMENRDSSVSLPLDEDFHFLLPGFGPKGTLKIKLDCVETTMLRYSVLGCEYRAGFRPGKVISEGEISVSTGAEQWIKLPVHPDQGTSYHIVLRKTRLVRIHCSPHSYTGFVARFANRKKLYHPCFVVEGCDSLFGAANLTNGFSRPHDVPNLWISDECAEAWVQLRWSKKISVKEIRLFFNPDLSRELVNAKTIHFSEHHGFIPRDSMPPELVKGYRISASSGEGLREIVDVADNIVRMAVHPLSPSVQTNSLRIEFTGTWGSPFFEVFEIRVY